MAANSSGKRLLAARRATAIPPQTRTGSTPRARAIVERVSSPRAESDAERHGERADTLQPALLVHAGISGFQLPPLDYRGDSAQPGAWFSC